MNEDLIIKHFKIIENFYIQLCNIINLFAKPLNKTITYRYLDLDYHNTI